MALIDTRGRVFGRINLIDAVVGLVLLGLIPLMYGAYVLFRQPQPSLVSITPSKLTPQVTRVQIKGRNLRPFLRISFNQLQGRTFAFVDSETAEVDLPDLPPGTYDVVLYDVARAISQLPAGLVVEGATQPLSNEARMLIVGQFVGLDDATARDLKQGTKLSAIGRNAVDILSRGTTAADRRWFNFNGYQIETPLTAGVQVAALLRATCSIVDKRCQVGGSDIEAGHGLTLYDSAGKGLRFEITDALGDGPTANVVFQARLLVPTESAALVKQGDHARSDPMLVDRAPLLLAVRLARSTTTVMTPPGPPVLGGGDWALQMTDDASLLDATVRLRADVTSAGLQYRGRPLRAGAPFVFEHERYVLRGWIRSLTTEPGANGERGQ